MKAIILSAGQGSRLLPHTQNLPKCLLPVSDEDTMLGWQLRQLAKAGIDEAFVVTGFYADKVETELARYADVINARAVFNPFYKLADNLGSVWLAKHEMISDFILLNGDTLFTAGVVEKLVRNSKEYINVTVSCKNSYDDDDMKVTREGHLLKAISKKLDLKDVNAESIGMIYFQDKGVNIFRRAVELSLYSEAALKMYYLSVINELSRHCPVGTVEIGQDQWGEVDFPADLESIREKVARWRHDEEDMPRAANA